MTVFFTRGTVDFHLRMTVFFTRGTVDFHLRTTSFYSWESWFSFADDKFFTRETTFRSFGRQFKDKSSLFKYSSWELQICLPPTWVCGKWGGRKLLNISNFILHLFRLTETFWILVSNSKSVSYIGGRSGRGVSNAPPDHKPFPLAAILKRH